MNSRERVLAALEHREADRVPIDFGGMRSTGITAIAYNKLKKHLGMRGGKTMLFDIMQQLAEPEEEILKRFHVDVVALNRLEVAFGIKNKKWKKWKLPDGSKCHVSKEFNPVKEEDGSLAIVDNGTVIARMPKSSLYFFSTYYPLADAETFEDIDQFSLSGISDEELEYLHKRAKHLYENTDYAIMGGFGGNVYETAQFTRGWDTFLMDLIANPGFANRILERITDCYMNDLKNYIDAVGDYVQIIQMGDDLGTQAGPQISPQLYRTMIKPYHKRLYDYIHQNSKMQVFLHCCGSVYELLPDIIDAGIDILNPVQTSAARMEPAELKKNFGDKITFWGGGCETQGMLQNGTIDDIVNQVKERIQIFGKGGGYVFNMVHNVQANVPPENVVAMFDAAYKYGGYVRKCGN